MTTFNIFNCLIIFFFFIISIAFILLSNGFQVKLHSVHSDDLSYALPPIRLPANGDERILHLKSLIDNCDVTANSNNNSSVSVRLFWLQSKPSRLFHALVDLNEKYLNSTQIILPNLSTITNGTNLPIEATTVSYFDVSSNCACGGIEKTYDLTIVNEINGVITIITLDSQFKVRSVNVAVNGTNPGQVVTSSSGSSLVWLDDSSCLKVTSLDHILNLQTHLPTLPPSPPSHLSSTSKVFCINQYSSDTIATAFHVEEKYGNYIYLVTSTGDVLRILPNYGATESSYQLLVNSEIYKGKDVLGKHPTTFNAIHVIESPTTLDKNTLKVFLSIKRLGFLIQLELNCFSPPNDPTKLAEFFAQHKNPCQFMGHKVILAEHNLFDFEMIDLNSTSSHCGNSYHSNLTHQHETKITVSSTTTNKNNTSTDSHHKTLTIVSLATGKSNESSSIANKPLNRKEHLNNETFLVNSTSVLLNQPSEGSWLRQPWTSNLAVPISCFTFIVIFIMGAYYYYNNKKNDPTNGGRSELNSRDISPDDCWDDEESLTNSVSCALPIAIEDIGAGLFNRANNTGACGDCSYKNECKERGICLSTYRLLNAPQPQLHPQL